MMEKMEENGCENKEGIERRRLKWEVGMKNERKDLEKGRI